MELNCGYPISIYVNGEWIRGIVEHNVKCYYFLADGLKMNLSQDLYVHDELEVIDIFNENYGLIEMEIIS